MQLTSCSTTDVLDFVNKTGAISGNSYAGIGSRETPANVLKLMTDIAKRLNSLGFVLRSGGAPGADTAFELGSSCKEIYLPWTGFNQNRSNLVVSKEAIEMGRKFHPNGRNLSQSVAALMGRNCQQILGRNLDSPAKFVICWTPDGEASGGTGQAIRVAVAYGIPVINLKKLDQLHRMF